jgi:flagellar protein FlaI
MKLKLSFGKSSEKDEQKSLESSKKKKNSEKVVSVHKPFKKSSGESKQEELIEGPIVGKRIPQNLQTVERYPLYPPFAYAIIAEDPEKKLPYYFVDELELSEREKRLYINIISTLQAELTAPREDVDPKKYFAEKARFVAERYRLTEDKNLDVSWAKILYYAERDMVGFGPIDPFMRDSAIEDISVDGASKPVYVYHRKYESLETNLSFSTEEQLDDMIARLVHMSGKHVSTAFPIVDATLPGKHRLAATFRREVSPQGSTMTIRKFREDPITIIDLINSGVLDYAVAAYAWLLIENRATAIVVGATASGKTTFLNALLSMINPNSKIVTIEEVQEINIHHTNWAPLVSRLSYGITEESIGEISLFHLVKTAMRMRPDIIVVGEVRGEEAYALFQAISTGHGGLATLHAEDAGSAIQRLTSKPMDVAPSYISFLDLIFSVRRVAMANPSNPNNPRIVRRLISVDEMVGFEKRVGLSDKVQTFTWNPQKDKFDRNLEQSVKLAKYAKEHGKEMEEVYEELTNRMLVLQWLRTKNVRNFIDIATIFSQYHTDPERVLLKIKMDSVTKDSLFSENSRLGKFSSSVGSSISAFAKQREK